MPLFFSFLLFFEENKIHIFIKIRLSCCNFWCCLARLPISAYCCWRCASPDYGLSHWAVQGLRSWPALFTGMRQAASSNSQRLAKSRVVVALINWMTELISCTFSFSLCESGSPNCRLPTHSACRLTLSQDFPVPS